MEPECGRLCPLLSFVLSRPEEQGGIFGILFSMAGRGYQVSFCLLVLVCHASWAIIVSHKMESCVRRSKGRDNVLLGSWGIPVVICAFTPKPMLLQLLAALDLFIWSLLCQLSQISGVMPCSPYSSTWRETKSSPPSSRSCRVPDSVQWGMNLWHSWHHLNSPVLTQGPLWKIHPDPMNSQWRRINWEHSRSRSCSLPLWE